MRRQPSAARFCTRQNRRGFSLIELTIVVLMTGIVAAVGVPRMARLVSSYRADSAAARLVADLKFASRQARLTGKAETVTFDVTSNRYSFSSTASSTASSAANSSVYSVDVSAYPYGCVIENASFGGHPLVTFDGYGFPNASGQVVVQSGNARRRIDLADVTGHVTSGRVSAGE